MSFHHTVAPASSHGEGFLIGEGADRVTARYSPAAPKVFRVGSALCERQ